MKFIKKLAKVLIVIGLLFFVSYQGCQIRGNQQIEKTNNLFDPEYRKLDGTYFFTFSESKIVGHLDSQNAHRIKELNSEFLEYGSMTKENIKLVIHASDGTFIITFN
jgi:hypothetical protein